MKFGILFSLVICLAVAASVSGVSVSTFDDLSLADESHWGGVGSPETGFTNGSASFAHTGGAYSWEGFAYSNETDNATFSYGNQFTSYAGGGAEGSNNYAVASFGLDYAGGTYDVLANTVSRAGVGVVDGAYFTNTTYAAGSMINGDMFAKKFGGASGDDADWLKMTVRGVDALGQYTGANAVEFYLADFRFADNSLDYVVDQWTWVDLSGLGAVAGLEFCMSSSDTGLYGMNTPAFFAMDGLAVVPEPMTIALLGLGGFMIARRKNK